MNSAGPPAGLPVCGYVLAGGRSSRMGRDKATLLFCGEPMIATALRTLRQVCAHVAIAANRDDLSCFAPVVPEARQDAGPVAGLEAGLAAAMERWSLFIPVDTPILRPELLRTWAERVLAREPAGVRLSYLRADGSSQPAICLLHRDCLAPLSLAVSAGVRRLDRLFGAVQQTLQAADGASPLWVVDAEDFVSPDEASRQLLIASFINVNSPHDLAAAERQACAAVGAGGQIVFEESGLG